MVQFITLPESTQGRLGREMGAAFSQGIAKNLPKPEQLTQRKLLSEAFAGLDPNLSYEEQLKSIVPTLMTTQGGPEALQTILPIMQQRSKNRAVMQAVEGMQQEDRPSQPSAARKAVEGAISPVGATPGEITADEVAPPSEDKFRRPTAPESGVSTFPQITAGPQIQPLMSPAEQRQYALDVMRNSAQTGTPIGYQEGMALAQQENQNREAYNQRISQEQKQREQNIKDLNADVVERAVNSGLIQDQDDEARTVTEKLGYEARNSANPAERWEHVRTGLREFNNAREAIRREASLPGPFESLYRKMIGSYKDKEQLQKSLRPHIEKYLEHGLYDEIRAELTSSLGMGPEDAELTIYPFSEEQNSFLKKVKQNEKKPGIPYGDIPVAGREQFPGESFNIQDEGKFQTFKDDLEKYLKQFPDANLVTLRGRLNQEKRYSWQDISRAVGELMEEQRFTPDNYQSSQLSIINNAPLPGLAEQFKNFWMGTR